MSPYEDPDAITEMLPGILAAEIEQETQEMGAVAKRETATAVQAEVIQTSPATIMEVISRAAADPNIDLVKLDRLLDMHERITARDAERDYNDAMSAAQTEMDPVRNDAHNPQTKSRYASYGALDRAIRPVYTRHGFSLSFYTGDGAPADHIRVVCKVAHKAGHCERPYIDMPADGKGAKGGDVMTKTHAAGSAVSYGQRYLLKMIFNIATGDDDGNKAGAGPTVTEDQASDLQAKMEEVGADRDRFLKFFGVERIAAIPAKRFNEAMRMLNAKGARK